ncbi:hypothetical protein P4E94_08420 [Pontiellaceae bacterium B12219]|nr:hypothetical protein [Pontiellaceae bacterium B12219]
MKKTMCAMMLGLLISAVANGQYEEEESNFTIQALLGGVRYDGLEFTGPGGSNTTDMASLPQLGGAWSTKPENEGLSFGLECTFLLGFKFDDVTTYTGASSIYVTSSSSLWLIDFSGGGFANLMLGNKVWAYAAAGPLVMLSFYDSDEQYSDGSPGTSQSETAYGFGAYARTGLEFEVHNGGYLGAGVRWNWSNIDFDVVDSGSNVSGIAGFLTYTANL